MNQTKGKVRLYAAGGCGTNIGAQLEKFRNSDQDGFANLDIVYVDTSKSNLRSEIDPKNCYMLDGLDGSGKLRSENHEQIAKHTKMVLQKFPACDLNVVLHSAAGGSGSVIGPLIASELMANDAPTVIIAIGSNTTMLDVNNTLKTLKSYDAISKKHNAPISLVYTENNTSFSRDQADTFARRQVIGLCILFSRENRELDSKDLFNFLRYHRVTSFAPQLTSLTMVSKEEKNEDLNIGNIISVASLVATGESAVLEQFTEVQYTGFLPEKACDLVMEATPLHFMISDGILPAVANRLQQMVVNQQKAQNARIDSTSALSASEPVTASGLVL